MTRKPIYSRAAQNGDLGMRLVETCVEEELGWKFRPKPLADVGIDGEIEVVAENREASGRLIAVQVKCGKSYFRSMTEEHIRIRVSKSHMTYWIDHSIPVVVIVCDPRDRRCYWKLITASDAVYTKNACVLHINRNNVFSNKSKYSFQSIANESLVYEAMRLSIYKLLHEKYPGRLRVASIMHEPRDWRGFDYYAKLDGEFVNIKVLTDTYGEGFSVPMIEDNVNLKKDGSSNFTDNIILSLTSQNPRSLSLSDEVKLFLSEHPQISTMRVHYSIEYACALEISEDDLTIDGYTEAGEPITMGYRLASLL